MIKKKIYLVFLLLVFVSGHLLAQGSQDKKVEGDQKEDVEITIMSRFSDEIPSSVYFREHLTKMSEEDNGITIIQDHINDEIAYYDKLRTKFATGEFPNIFIDYGGSRTVDYVKSNILVDLKPYLEEDSEWADAFMPLFDKWVYDEYPGIWGVPAEFYAIGIFYNKDIFEEVGVQIPKTIEEFELVCDQLLEAGYIPMALGNKDVWRAGHLFNNIVFKTFGVSAVSDLADRSLPYDSPEITAVYDRINDYKERGFFGPNPINMDYNREKTSFHNGESAMHMDGSWYLGEGTNSAISDVMGVFPFPSIEPEYEGIWMGGAAAGFSLVDTEDDREIEAAIKVLKSITSASYFKEVQRVNKGGVYPVKFKSDKSIIDDLTLEYSEMIKQAEEFRDAVQTYDPLSSTLETVRQSLQGLFIGNTPDECGEQIVKEIKSRE